MPKFIFKSKEITVGAKLTYAMLLKYACKMDECFSGQDRLASDMDNCWCSVMGSIAELEKVGLVSIRRRGKGRPDLYKAHVKGPSETKERDRFGRCDI